MPKTIGIVGSRRRNTYEDYKRVERALLSVYQVGDGLVSGGCPKGADRFAARLAYLHGIRLHEWLPDQSKLDQVLIRKGLIRAAYTKINYARSTLIARDAGILIACVAPDHKGGTEDTIKKFCKQRNTNEKQAINSGLLILV